MLLSRIFCWTVDPGETVCPGKKERKRAVLASLTNRNRSFTSNVPMVDCSSDLVQMWAHLAPRQLYRTQISMAGSPWCTVLCCYSFSYSIPTAPIQLHRVGRLKWVKLWRPTCCQNQHTCVQLWSTSCLCWPMRVTVGGKGHHPALQACS